LRWLAVWLLLTVVYAGALVLCRPLAGAPVFGQLSRGDLANLLLIPAAQVAALAALAATKAQRRQRERRSDLRGEGAHG
jgi:hypothetical protein